MKPGSISSVSHHSVLALFDCSVDGRFTTWLHQPERGGMITKWIWFKEYEVQNGAFSVKEH